MKKMSERSARDIILMIVGVLSVCVGIIVLAQRLPSHTLAPVSPDMLHAQWIHDVHIALDGLGSSATAQQLEQAKMALLDMRIAGQDKAAHLALVLAVIAWQKGSPQAVQQFSKALRAVGQ